jgi:Ca2+-binding EF-hand superfamily protein
MDISSMGASMPFMQQMSGMRSRPDPSQIFAKVDQNGDGGLDQSEFQSMANKIGERTGETIDAAEVFASFDADQDGLLSQEETKSVMEAYKPAGPPSGGMPMGGAMKNMQPPTEMAIQEYQKVDEMDQSDASVTALIEALTEEDEESSIEALFSIDTEA